MWKAEEAQKSYGLSQSYCESSDSENEGSRSKSSGNSSSEFQAIGNGAVTTAKNTQISKTTSTVIQTVLGVMKFGRKRTHRETEQRVTAEEATPVIRTRCAKSPMMKRNLWSKTRARAVAAQSASVTEVELEESPMMCSISDGPNFLFKMAAKGKVAEIASVCNAQPHRMLCRDEKQANMLHHAAANGRKRVMEYILSDQEGKTLIDAKDECEATPLFWAIECDNGESVEYLLSNGADPTLSNIRGEAPIHASIRAGSLNALRALLKYKSIFNINQPQSLSCVTPMHVAAEFDNENAARMLLDAGAKLCVPCQQGYRPLHTAALHGSRKVLKLLVEKCAKYGYTSEQILSFNDKENCSPLHCAVLGGNAETIEMCLEYGARLDTQQVDKTTPMHMVCAQGAHSVVEGMFTLAREQALRTLSMQDAQKQTPLHKAAMYGHSTIVKYLANQGADLDIMDSDQNTPLLLAASRGNWISVQDLIELGADLMIKNKDDRNFLHMIVLGGGDIRKLEIYRHEGKSFEETCRGILCKPEVQGLLNQADSGGCTPLHYACQEGNLASLETLMTLGVSAKLKSAGNQSALHFAARYGRYNACKKLINCPQGPNIINEKDNDGMTPLHYASQNGHTKVVQLLLNKGAACHSNIRGESVLHVTAANGYTRTIKILIAMNRTLIDTEDENGDTPLHHAGQATQVNTVKLLLDLGAKLKRNTDGHTYFTQAIQNENREVALATIVHDRWNQAMREFYVTKEAIGIPSLLMIQHLPDVWVVAMNRCIETAECSPKSKDYWIKYEFKYLQPTANIRNELKKKIQETFEEPSEKVMVAGRKDLQNLSAKEKANRSLTLPALNKMVQYNRVECLRHPVSAAYLQMKWNAYGRWVHGLNLFIYFWGLIPLTFLICTMDSSNQKHFEANGFFNETSGITYPVKYSTLTLVMMIVLMVLSIGQLLKELVQLYQQKKNYFLDVTNLFEWVLYVSSLLYVIPFFSGYPKHWQFEFGAIAVLLAWFNLLMFFQRFDVTGIYVVMFLVILRTLLKVLALFSLLIIAFALAFYAILQNEADQSFTTPMLSFVRIVTMTMGEINYVDSFLNPFVDGDDGTLHYAILSFVMLMLFIVVMPILLMNLLIGLAVGDIAEVQSNAELQRLAMQVQLHTDIETKLSTRILRHIDKDELVVWPNKKCGPFNKLVDKMTARSEVMPDYAEPPISITDRNINHLHVEVQRQKERLKDMQATLHKQHELLRLIVQKMEIRSEADEQDEGTPPESSHRLAITGTVGSNGGLRKKLAAANAFRALMK